MSSINIIAIVLGLITIITRLPGVIWPKNMREFTFKFLESNLAVKLSGLFGLTLSILIFFLFLRDKSLLEIVIIVLAIIWLPTGIGIFFSPESYKNLALKILGKSLSRIRFLSLIGCIIGVLLVLLGIFG